MQNLAIMPLKQVMSIVSYSMHVGMVLKPSFEEYRSFLSLQPVHPKLLSLEHTREGHGFTPIPSLPCQPDMHRREPKPQPHISSTSRQDAFPHPKYHNSAMDSTLSCLLLPHSTSSVRLRLHGNG